MKLLTSYILLLAAILLQPMVLWGQHDPVDSLNKAMSVAKADTLKLNLLIELCEFCEETDILKYADPAIKLANKLLAEELTTNLRSKILDQKASLLNNVGFYYNSKNNSEKSLSSFKESLKIEEDLLPTSGSSEQNKRIKKNIATALNDIGFIYFNLGNISEAIAHFNTSLKFLNEIGDKEGIAQSLNNIGFIFDNQGNIPKAIEYYSRSLKIREEIGNKRGIAQSINNLGLLYNNQGDNKTAVSYYLKSLLLQEAIDDKAGIANSFNNIGSICYKEGDHQKALYYYEKSIQIKEEIGDKQGLGYSFKNMGDLYANKGDITKALDYYNKSLRIETEIGDKKGIAFSLNSLGSIYLKQNKYQLALLFLDSSLIISKKLGFPENIKNCERLLFQIDSIKRNYKGAFEHFKQFIIYRDSIINEGTRKASIKNQLNYEFEKKEAVIKEQQEKEHIISEEKNRFQQIIIASVLFGLILVIVFAAFVSRSLKTTRNQKHLIEEKQKEILDSIRYAKRIQTAVMSNENYINNILNRLKN